MPVTRESIIQHLYSTSVSAQPDATLELGEIAINAADEALFIKNASGTVKKLSATTDLTANLVTISTAQTVSGDKTFSGTVTLNNGLVFEGATADNFETTLGVVDPTVDRTITIPDASGTVALVAGSDTQVQFNDGGNLGGDSGLTYNKTTDSLTITGDLAVNGSDITTSGSGTATLFNSNALTLNLGGAATAITMGDSTTATTTIRGGTLVGNTTTQNLFNTTATTLNLGGAATTMSIGNTATAAQTVNMFTASTGASTYNFATGATAAATSKTLNIGTGGSVLSITNINIGTGSSGAPVVRLGSSSDGYVEVVNPYLYCASTVFFGGSLAQENYIAGIAPSMVSDGAMSVHTETPSMYIGGYNSALVMYIGDYDGTNDGTLITVDETSDNIVLNAGSGVVINQDLAVNGGDVTTTTTGTATLFNTSATTLNLGGVATSITMGATSGTTTTIRGGTLVGNTTTQNVFNTTATTVNAFGAATTVNMGGASTNTVFAGTVEIDGTNALQFPDGTIQVTRTPDFILFNLGII